MRTEVSTYICAKSIGGVLREAFEALSSVFLTGPTPSGSQEPTIILRSLRSPRALGHVYYFSQYSSY